MRIVDLELGELAGLPSPPFGGEPVFLVVSHRGEVFGACFVPRVETPEALARHLAEELGHEWRTRAVASAIGDPSAWRRPDTPGPVDPVSVVVCTIDRPLQLRRCLDSLRPQLLDDDELIVVDNSRAGTGRRMAESRGCRWVAERRPGSSWARNRGWHEATRPLVAYVDDDCVADRTWLASLREPLAAPAVDGVTGGVLARRADLAVPLLVDSRYSFLRGWRPIDFVGGTGTRWSPFDSWLVGTGASMAWRRSTLERLGGFDPALGAGTAMGGGEELDLFRRALAAGATIAYRPGALVWHDHPETLRSLRRMLVQHALGAGARTAKVVLEEGRRRPLLLLARDVRWELGWARHEMANLVLRRPRFPVLALLSYGPATALGALRFARRRHHLRSAPG